MSDEQPKRSLSGLLSGRWQVPLALVAAFTAGGTLYSLLPGEPPPNFDALMADINVLEQAGDTLAAADAVANLLEVDLDPALTPAQEASLHRRWADLVFQAERKVSQHNEVNVRNILMHEDAARDLGAPPSARSTMRRAYAHYWLGDEDTALAGFRGALEEGLEARDRRDSLRMVVELLERRPEAKLERRKVLTLLLDDETISPAYLWWALHQSVRDALDEGDVVRARDLLTHYGERLKSSDLKGYLDYLWAFVKLHEGRPEEAAPLARWVDDWIGESSLSSSELDHFGHLPSLNRWLTGRIHLAEDRPQDALRAFDDALAYQPNAELTTAATVGRGLALGSLGRHSEALDSFRMAVEDLRLPPSGRRWAIYEFGKALRSLFESNWERKAYADALPYLDLAAELIPKDQTEDRIDLYEQLGQMYEIAAEAASGKQARQYHEQSGTYFEHAADLLQFDEERLANVLWDAARQYDESGRLAALRRVLLRFVEGRSEHPQMPRALLQLGGVYEAFGQLEESLEWYGKVTERFPRIGEAARARVLSAGVLISLGAERLEEAERILTDLIVSGDVSPDAPVFREALLTLCDLLYHQGRYADAIGRLQDFLRLYPNDENRLRARFMLADAHRRSAYELRDAAGNDIPLDDALAESRSRFIKAADLYHSLLQEPAIADGRDKAAQLYERLALFYRADCLFELNEPETLREALKTYRNGAARYDGHPAALVAQVQIANVFLRLGDVTEAARAVERARWLVRSIPEETYAHRGSASRDDWQRYLDTVASSDLFKDVFVETP